MSETMIERVAKAIYEKRNGVGCKPWNMRPKAHKAPYLSDARAAIEAMREPTRDMLIAAAVELERQHVALDEVTSEPIYPGQIFDAMISAALSPSQAG